jgi:uncharacterized protein YqeY
MGESLRDRIRAELNAARRCRDRQRTMVLTMLLSEIRNRELEKGSGTELGDEEITEVISRSIRRRREAAEQMRAGGRTDLADAEEREAEILGSYLPAALSEAEVRERVRQAIAAGASDLGEVMRRLMPEIRGRFEGKEANRIAREELG